MTDIKSNVIIISILSRFNCCVIKKEAWQEWFKSHCIKHVKDIIQITVTIKLV